MASTTLGGMDTKIESKYTTAIDGVVVNTTATDPVTGVVVVLAPVAQGMVDLKQTFSIYSTEQ